MRHPRQPTTSPPRLPVWLLALIVGAVAVRVLAGPLAVVTIGGTLAAGAGLERVGVLP